MKSLQLLLNEYALFRDESFYTWGVRKYEKLNLIEVQIYVHYPEDYKKLVDSGFIKR